MIVSRPRWVDLRQGSDSQTQTLGLGCRYMSFPWPPPSYLLPDMPAAYIQCSVHFSKVRCTSELLLFPKLLLSALWVLKSPMHQLFHLTPLLLGPFACSPAHLFKCAVSGISALATCQHLLFRLNTVRCRYICA